MTVTELSPDLPGAPAPEDVFLDAGAPASEDVFLDALEGLAQAVRRARGAAPADRDLLTISQLALLAPLGADRAARVSDLAGRASITPPTATRILDALERRGVVRRSRSPEDRRAVTVTLTDHGAAVLDRQDAWVRARKLAFYAGLEPGHRAVASELLAGIAGLIDELSAGPGPSPEPAVARTPVGADGRASPSR